MYMLTLIAVVSGLQAASAKAQRDDILDVVGK